MTGRMRRVGALLLGVAMLLGATGCSARSGEWSDADYVIAGGGSTGVYYDYGGRLAEELTERLGVSMSVVETDGSVDNLLRIDAGEALLGFAQGDAAADAVAGAGVFDEPLELRAVARLYDEYLHIVVRDDSDITELSDLVGKRVSLGAPTSGVHVIAERLLDAADVDIEDVHDRELGLGASIQAMERGEIDGFFWVGGLPTPGIEQLAEGLSVRLLPVSQDWVNSVNAQNSGAYRPADIPAGAYGRDESTPTMAVPNYLMTAADTPDAVAKDIVEVLFDARQRMAQKVPVAALLDRRQAIFTDPVDLHEGAIDFFREGRN